MADESENLTLYVKGKTPTELEDVWDDTVLNSAYDKALKLANEEVAKRIAMETNSFGNSKSKSSKGKQKAKKESPKPEPDVPMRWQEGMPCRAIYEEDGLEYEAIVTSFVDDEDCIVKFLGYENSETVPINSLKPTLGNEARMQQLHEATGERADDGFESQDASESVELYSDDPSSVELLDMPPNKRSDKKKSGSKKNNRGQTSHFGDLPNIPMPNMNMIRNLGGGHTPLPPPPPLLRGDDAEQQAISDMLLSWYMTGYYTGLYQGMKRQKSQSRRYQ